MPFRSLKHKFPFRSPKDNRKQQSGTEGSTSTESQNGSDAAANPNKPSESSDYGERSIRELWDLAYEKLREEDEGLIKDYEAKLCGDLSVGLSSTLGSKVGMRERTQAILQRKMEEVNRDIWKLKFGSSQTQVRDLVQPVLGVVNWVNDYIKGAVSASPFASVAWVGVSLLLPLFLNPSDQGVSLAKGLEYISSLTVRSWMWEDLYIRRYEARTSQHTSSLPSHTAYKIALEKLYRQILLFQATSYCYYAENSAFRLGLDIVKWNDWDKLLSEIKDKEREFTAVSDNWRDMKHDEECSAADQRHQEAIRRWQTIGTDISGLREAVESAQAEKTRDGLLQWLCTVDHSGMYNAARDKHESGTCEWLVRDSKEFKTWEGSSSSLLWVHGKAGSGKSILSSSVVKYLQDRYASDPESASAYFFFSFSDLEKQKVDAMLGSLIKQLYASRPDTPQVIKNLGEYKKKGERPDTKTLEAALIAAGSGFSSVSIVIDALDECPALNEERNKLLGSLGRIIATMPDNFQLFCTSRAEPDIKLAISIFMSPPSRADIDLTVKTRGVNHDIGLYIDSVFASANYNSWPSDLKAEAKALLIQRADGMYVLRASPIHTQHGTAANSHHKFQYIFCQFEALQNLFSIPLIRTALQQLPIGLDATYDRLLQSIDTKFQPQVVSLLKWLAFSKYPLGVEELAEIFILDADRVVAFDEAERLLKPEDCLRYTSSLVVIQDSWRGPVARLAHFSVREYLMSDRIAEGPAACFSFTEPEAHLHIAHSCLAYHLQRSAMREEYVEHLKLRHYAAEYWMQHLEMVPREAWPTGVTLLAARALATRSESFRLTLENVDIGYLNLREDRKSVFLNMLQRPQCFTAQLGFCQLTNMLLYSGPGRNEYMTQGDWDMTVQGAAYGGSMAVVQLLLSEGINTGNDTLGGALCAAASRGHVAIVKFLLDNGADINTQHRKLGSPLQAATSGDRFDVMQLLISHGADVNLPPNEAGSAITSAVKLGGTRGLQLLLDSGADINSKGGAEGTALHKAAGNIREFGGCFHLLLERGADVNAQGGTYGYPLQAACTNEWSHRPFSEYRAEVELLLERGADVNAQGGEYGNALKAACSNSTKDLVEFLLEKGADVGIQGGVYGSALQAACRYGNLDKAQLLLDHGADVNAEGGIYGNALQAACYSGKWQMWECAAGCGSVRLLNHGAEVNVEGGKYGTALQAACTGDTVDIARLLIEHGADAHDGSAWHLAASRFSDNINMLQLLLNHGHDINDTRVPDYGTALQAAIEVVSYSIDKIRFLLDRGADANANAGRYGFPLQSACAANIKRHPIIKDGARRAEYLLQNCPNLEINAVGGIFGSALQAAAYSGQTDLVKLLLDKGANPNAGGGECRSALNAAILRGFWDIVEILLDHGAKSDRQQLLKPDEEWLARIQQEGVDDEDVYDKDEYKYDLEEYDEKEDGKEAVERYRIFWERQPVGENAI
ncbi:ankyrin repeat-containing domain protein [Xylaria longipes]|nr:ankyrin repeat-containing domain protein [Xylaria longipes]